MDWNQRRIARVSDGLELLKVLVFYFLMIVFGIEFLHYLIIFSPSASPVQSALHISYVLLIAPSYYLFL